MGRPKGSKNKVRRFEIERRPDETDEDYKRRYAAETMARWRARHPGVDAERMRAKRAERRAAAGPPKIRGKDLEPRKNARPEWLRKECEIRPGETPEEHKRRETKAAMAWWRSINPEQSFKTSKGGHLKRFGISLAEYEAMLAQQNHACAICKLPERAPAWKQRKPRMLAVDHCHTTGKIRGLLCFRCNTVVGHIEESLETTMSLYHYLDKHAEIAPKHLKEEE